LKNRENGALILPRSNLENGKGRPLGKPKLYQRWVGEEFSSRQRKMTPREKKGEKGGRK